MKKKIIITGSNGFIGKNLKEHFLTVPHLQDHYCIICPNRVELNLFEEKEVAAFFKREKADIVIHSAVQGTLGKPQYKQLELGNNLRMFFNLEKCKEYFGRLYYFGSGAEYSQDAYIPGMKEEYFDHSIPADQYGFSKYIMSRWTTQCDNIYDLRLFGVFGQYENYNYRFISNAICKALCHKDIIIRQNVFFDYLYIKDLCKIMEWFIENKPQFKHYNVCTGKRVDILHIAQIIKEKINTGIKIGVVNDGLGNEYTGNNSRLLKELGSISFTEIEQAIAELITYYRGISFHLEGNY